VASFANDNSNVKISLQAFEYFNLNKSSDLFVPVTHHTFSSVGLRPKSVEPYICVTLKPIPNVRPQNIQEHTPAGNYPVSSVDASDKRVFRIHALYIVTLQNAIITESFLVLTNSSELINKDFSSFPVVHNSVHNIQSIFTEITSLHEETALLKIIGKVRRVEEPCILISGGPDGAQSYYHWLIDYLPRISLFLNEASFHDLKFIVNHDLSSFQLETFRIMGIDQSRLIHKEKNEWLVCNTLHAPSFLSRTGVAHPKAIAFLRQQFFPVIQDREDKGPRRIYFSRKDSPYRRIVNEAEVGRFLRQHDFETIVCSELSFAEQI
jgi:hypothetical protein